MSKYENFNNLVANHLETAERSLSMDICYIFGLMDGRNYDCDVSLGEIDKSYDFKGVHVVIGDRDKEYVMYVLQNNQSANLGTVSKSFEKYQIADILADIYLNFYMNTNVEALNNWRG